MSGFFNPFVGGTGGTGGGDSETTIIDLLQAPYLSTIQNGSLSDDTGQPVSRKDRATCYSYINIPDGSTRFKVDIAISGAAGKYFVDLYDENENYLYSATSSIDLLTGVAYYSFVNSGVFRQVHPDAKKIRVGVRNASNSNFSASSITNFKVMFVGSTFTATDIFYSGLSSGISATDVQGAIDEVQENVNTVNTRIDDLPEPMIFKGSLGTGGTITILPVASDSNKGFTYKVITAGTYASQSAKIGDTFISDGTVWVLIPSGDEPSGTVTNVAVTSTDGSATITGSPITSSGIIDISVNVDNELSDISTNPVQNKTVNDALATKQDSIADLADIRSGAAAGATAVQQTTFETDQQRQEVEIGVVANAGAKNLLENVQTTMTHKGVTFTVNNDGSVTATGTNDGTGASIIDVNTQTTLTLPNGDYILSGCPSGGSETGYFMDVTRSPGSSIKDIGNGAAFTVGGDYTINEFRIVISRNVTVDNLTFYPMIRQVADDTFVPYAKTNRELTVAENEDRAALVDLVDAGAKNDFDLDTLFPSAVNYHATVSKSNGTVLITSTGNYGRCAIPYTFKAGIFVFSCSVSNFIQAGGTSTIRFSTNSDGSGKIAEPVTISGDGKYSTKIAVSSDTAGYIILYINSSGDSYINSASFSDLMVCTAADYTINPDFVPYRPSYDDLIDEVNQLKNYTGYEKSQILGLQVDYQNKTFTRLAKAVDLIPGSDFNQFNIYNKRRRCNVSDDGTINAFYGESSYIEDGTNGQVMVYQPKFYYKVEPLKLEPITDGEGYHIRKANYYISETPRNGFKLHPAFKDENGNELEYYLIGAYEASLYDVSASTYILDDAQVADFSTDKICSIANAKPISGVTQNLTRSNCEKLATNRGTRWHNMTIQIASAEQLLFMIEYGKMNAQEAIGKGVVNKASGSGNEAINTGLTSDLGNASGTASGTDGLVSITYRGVENLWGNIWNWIDGINIWGDGTKKGGIPYITDKLSFEENTKIGYNSTGFTTSGTNGYISAMGYGNPDYDWIFFASETTGNSTIPVGDYQYYSPNLNGYRVARLGGSWDSALGAGLFYWCLADSSSYRYRNIGGRGVSIPDINATNYWTNIHKAN